MLQNALVNVSNERLELELWSSLIFVRSSVQASKRPSVQAFKRSSVQAFKRWSVQASKRSSVQTNVQTFKRPSVQTFKHSSVQAFKRSSDPRRAPWNNEKVRLSKVRISTFQNYLGGSNFEFWIHWRIIWGVRISNYGFSPDLFVGSSDFELILKGITTEHFHCFRE